MKTVQLSKNETGWLLTALVEATDIIDDITGGAVRPASLYRAVDIVMPKVLAAWPMPEKRKRKAANKKKAKK